MYYQSKKTIEWKKNDYTRTILLFALHTFIIVLLYGIMLFWNAYRAEVDTAEFLIKKETISKLLYVAIAVVLLAAGIYLYFFNENKDFILRSKNIHLVFIIIEVSILAMYITGLYLNVKSRPFALCALLMLLLINKRSAIFINGVTCIYVFLADAFLAVSSAADVSVYSALVINYTTSLLAIYIVGRVSSRLKVFVTGFVIAVPIALSYAVLDFNTFLLKPWQAALDGLWSGMLSVVLMMAFLPFFEKCFNVLTDYRLMEITDHKSLLIKTLIENAPGTFNHSLVVSTLAESCATAIGENPLLARACAYYHDIGKLKQPEFFTENQKGYNPHNELTPELSTDIIRSHTKDGYDLIRKISSSADSRGCRPPAPRHDADKVFLREGDEIYRGRTRYRKLFLSRAEAADENRRDNNDCGRLRSESENSSRAFARKGRRGGERNHRGKNGLRAIRRMRHNDVGSRYYQKDDNQFARGRLSRQSGIPETQNRQKRLI